MKIIRLLNTKLINRFETLIEENYTFWICIWFLTAFLYTVGVYYTMFSILLTYNILLGRIQPSPYLIRYLLLGIICFIANLWLKNELKKWDQ